VILATADAHGLYRPFGFDELANADRYLAVQQSPAQLYGS
jgi:hypothetical protein